MTLPRPLLPLVVTALAVTRALAAPEPALESRLPLKPEVRKVFDNSCVMCHGEVINGEKEIRGDLDLSNDATIRDTLTDMGKLKYYIEVDKMPHKPRLSKRLRGDTAQQERLTALKEAYKQNGERAVLLKWLEGVEAKKPADEKD